MTALPNDPLTAITPAGSVNTDLPSEDFPSLARIGSTELVGPPVSNRQHIALEKRTESLIDRMNKLISLVNAIDLTYLRRDGSAAKDSVIGMVADLVMAGHKITGLPAPVANGQPVRWEEYQSILAILASSANRIPTGMVSDFANGAPPGWLNCDGTVYSTSVLPSGYSWADLTNLRNYLGATYGGDGTNSFGVPDYRGRTRIGNGTGPGLTARTIGASGGEETHVLTVTEMPSHNHDIDVYGRSGSAGSVGNSDGSPTHFHNTTAINNKGGDGAHNNMQPFAVARPCIKV